MPNCILASKARQLHLPRVIYTYLYALTKDREIFSDQLELFTFSFWRWRTVRLVTKERRLLRSQEWRRSLGLSKPDPPQVQMTLAGRRSIATAFRAPCSPSPPPYPTPRFSLKHTGLISSEGKTCENLTVAAEHSLGKRNTRRKLVSMC